MVHSDFYFFSPEDSQNHEKAQMQLQFKKKSILSGVVLLWLAAAKASSKTTCFVIPDETVITSFSFLTPPQLICVFSPRKSQERLCAARLRCTGDN